MTNVKQTNDYYIDYWHRTHILSIVMITEFTDMDISNKYVFVHVEMFVELLKTVIYFSVGLKNND